MINEWKQRSTVRADGRVEVVVPGLKPGSVVEVAVRSIDETLAAERPLGLLKGKIHIGDNFDAPLDEFEPYT